MTIPIPRMAATIERRLLVNFRVDPDAAAAMLPDGVRPQVVDGSAVAGVCLIRLGNFRPAGFPPRFGHRSENAAHRIAVEWDGPDGPRTGVYIPRRHSASLLARVAGGRIFPGVHERARVESVESRSNVSVRIDAADLHVHIDVDIVEPEEFHSTLFSDLTAASEFFRKDAVGWSPTRSGQLETLRLDTNAWRVEPGHAIRVESSFFDTLPAGTARFDHVLVMRNVPVFWSGPAEKPPTLLHGMTTAA
ncbi:DUF2071 domain-containing protein [Leifsonia sp. fls2-241-R2A-40a]|uniref:DUF2071 domain-containing protein n=1 Tax=Leifsonia sp. fls2-241-R2A-40a TaxID=3040290 RepID=UPI002550AB52|nr:DUF2071 domain-containing protein [Leifsonia sp. fls2-241-R2A-40a]